MTPEQIDGYKCKREWGTKTWLQPENQCTHKQSFLTHPQTKDMAEK